MKIIFLDIDGVLNGYNYWNTLGWEIINAFNSKKLKNWYRNIADPFGIHVRKMKRLAKIVQETGAKIVLSSSWRIGLWKTRYEDMYYDQKKFVDLCNKYNIDVIDITPSSLNNRRDKEILMWLSKHEKDIESFIILDDENTILQAFNNDKRFIQTSCVPKGVMITGRSCENTGLNNKHVKQAIRILNEETLNEY